MNWKPFWLVVRFFLFSFWNGSYIRKTFSNSWDLHLATTSTQIWFRDLSWRISLREIAEGYKKRHLENNKEGWENMSLTPACTSKKQRLGFMWTLTKPPEISQMLKYFYCYCWKNPLLSLPYKQAEVLQSIPYLFLLALSQRQLWEGCWLYAYLDYQDSFAVVFHTSQNNKEFYFNSSATHLFFLSL